MTYSAAQARQQIVDVLGEAAEEVELALASLGEAYEQLDENSAERLEEELFKPVQAAYGMAKRARAEFAQRHQLSVSELAARPPGAPSKGARGFIEAAVEAVDRADAALIELQDSMLPVEVGDDQVRAGIAGVRGHLDRTRARARELVRTLGR